MIKKFVIGIYLVLGIWCFGFKVGAATFSNIELTSLSDSSMAITWSTTDESSSTQILYGVGGLTSSAEVSGSTKYHYIEISGLSPDTTYKYRLKSGNTYFPPETLDPITFTTLSKPTGQYLFSFAVLNDVRYAEGKASTKSARGIPYQYVRQIVSSEVTDINNRGPAFTIVNGNLADTDNSTTYGDQVGDTSYLMGILDRLTGASDIPTGGDKYFPVPGYQDKRASYSGNWITKAFKPLTLDPGSAESRYGYVSADNTKDSIFNYKFRYNYYDFIFLDSAKADGTGQASIEALKGLLSTDAKTFVFMAYPGYDPLASSTKDYPLDIPTSEVSGGLSIQNSTDFQATVEAYKDSGSNPIVAAVISSHLGDNFKREINNISYARQASALQFPTGYSIYKIYTNGYIKTFYKTTGRDSNDKPYYEYARDQISAESGIAADSLTQFWLGQGSARNHTFTYPFIPNLAPSVLSAYPGNNDSKVSLNQPILITFNKTMSTTDLNNWVTISPAVGSISAAFLDSDRMILKVDHADFAVDQTYTVTVLASKAKDKDGGSMASDYSFSFNTNGSSRDTTPPTAEVNPLPNNSTTDPFPSFVGIATDESGIGNVEYRVWASGSWITAWISAEAIDRTFNSTTEAFKINLSTPLRAGSYQIWLRVTDAAGNYNVNGFSAYSFTVTEPNPAVSLTINGNSPLTGDPISATPKFEITIQSTTLLETLRFTLDSTPTVLSFTRSDNTYYATHEVTSALSDGIHGITIEAFASLSKTTTYEVYPLYVQTSGDLTIQGQLLNYPNPFDPGNPASPTTTIGYVLSKPGNITLRIFDLAGGLIAKRDFSSGNNGGRAGYNTVTWDGRSDSGSIVGNGIYIYLIIADGKVAQNGKGKITVFKQ